MNGKARLNGSPYSTPPVPASRAHALRLALVCGTVLLLPGRWAKAVEAVDFNREIRPLLSRNCSACHGPDEKKREAGLRLDARESAVALRDDHRAIAPGDPLHSDLLRRVKSDDADERMPPASTGKRLTVLEIDRLTEWIRQGAIYTPHWAYVKPIRPQPPQVADRAWPRTKSIAFFSPDWKKRSCTPCRRPTA